MSDEDEEDLFVDRSPFIMVAKLLLYLGLSPYAGWLMVRILDRAGLDSVCYENTTHLAEACRMSTAQVSRAKAELRNAGLIKVEKKSFRHGHFPSDIITPIPLWKENKDYFGNNNPVTVGNRTYYPQRDGPVTTSVLNDIPINDYPHKLNPKKQREKSPADNGSQSAEGKSPSASSKQHTYDNRLKHKTIQDFKKVTGFYPHKAIRQLVMDTFPDGLNCDLAKDKFIRWVAKGANPKNLDWLFKDYRNNWYYEHPRDNDHWNELLHPNKDVEENIIENENL
jgi:hypothetical protein